MICSTLDFLIEGCPSLREMRPRKGYLAAYWTSELEHLEAFEARMLVENPNATVISSSEGGRSFFFFVLFLFCCTSGALRENAEKEGVLFFFVPVA